MRYSLEELENMPIYLLRGIDIQSKEEEVLVQGVLNKKYLEMPAKVDLSISSSLTDDMTPEKESELQAEIDAKKEEYKVRVFAGTVDDNADTVKTGDNLPPANTQNIPKRFCEFCTSKGVRHKKDCTRLLVNNIKI